MRKKLFSGKRLLTMALAATMLLGEASAVIAAPSNENAFENESASSNDGTTTNDSTTTDETSVYGSYNGNVSKVIGLEATTKSGGSTKSNDKGEVQPYYSVSSRNAGLKALADINSSNSVCVSGNLEYTYENDSRVYLVDEATGLFKYGDVYYYSAFYYSKGNYTSFNYPVSVKNVNASSEEVTAWRNQNNWLDAHYATRFSVYNNKIYFVWKYGVTSNKAGNTVLVEMPDEYLAQYEYEVVASFDKPADKTDYSEECQALIDSFKTEFGLYKASNGKSYYSINNKYYYYDNSKVYLLAAKSYEVITEQAYRLNFNWNEISTKEIKTTEQGKAIMVGYQVMLNDVVNTNIGTRIKDADGNMIAVTSSNYFEMSPLLVGESAKLRVRAVYYTMNETKVMSADGASVRYTVEDYSVYKYGEWSEECAGTITAPSAFAMPTDLAASVTGKKVKVTWTPFDGADNSYLKVVYCKEPLTVPEGKTIDTMNKSGIDYRSDYTYLRSDGINKGRYDFTLYFDNYQYIYVYMKLDNVKSGYEYPKTDAAKLSNIALIENKQSAANTPEIKNFRVEYNDDGGFDLVWDQSNSNAQMALYCYTAEQFPAFYNYDVLNAKRVPLKEDGSLDIDNAKYYDDLSYNLTADTAAAMRNVQINTYYDTYGKGRLNWESLCSRFKFTNGRTYYFAAMTYDTFDSNTVAKAEFEYDGIKYNSYNYIGPEAKTSAVVEIGRPVVYTSVTSDSVKLSMAGNSTGYIIYKKNSKGKFKEFARTTDNYYTDNNLEIGKTYSYRVYAYDYNLDSGVVTKSKKYAAVSATTSKIEKFEVKAVQSSAKKVKVSWTKVNKAVKYEVYRSTTNNKDYLNFSNRNKISYGTSWKLVKTIKKYKKNSFTENVSEGSTYLYKVVASYKDGKKAVTIENYDGVYMGLSTPVVTATESGASVKLSWDKNKYATGYEITFEYFDADGFSTSDGIDSIVSVNSNTYTIGNIPTGGYVTFAVRAFNTSTGKFSDSSEYGMVYNHGLSTVTGVKASYNAQTGKIDVAWSPVAGAAYYKVIRSTKLAYYDEISKKYSDAPDSELIAKESNDNETANVVYYKDYQKTEGTITATSASDAYAYLKTGVKYYYQVIAYGEHGKTQSVAYSKPVAVNYAIATPAIKSVKNSKGKKAVIKYSSVAAASGKTTYVIYRSTKKNGTYTKVGSTSKTSYTDKKLKKGKTYFYKVVAKGTNGLDATFELTSGVKKVKIKK